MKENADVQDVSVQDAPVQANMVDLRAVAHTIAKRTQLSPPEVNTLIDKVGQIVPSGNVPSLILGGLSRLGGRAPSEAQLKGDVRALFRGAGQVLDKAVYSTFFATPATIIWGYQNLLKLAGKDPEAAFPEGTWQFYVDYALREDTARHANETHGFDTALSRNNISLSQVDRITAWTMAAIDTLHDYDEMLKNEWTERLYLRAYRELDESEDHQQRYTLYEREWRQILPYRRRVDARGDETYSAYRRRKFAEFFFHALVELNDVQLHTWREVTKSIEALDSRSSYQQQLNIMSTLDPDAYGEERSPIDLQDACIGIIHEKRYYLIRACQPNSTIPPTFETVRAQIAAILNHHPEYPPAELTMFAEMKRGSWPDIRETLPTQFNIELMQLRQAPILLNFDQRDANAPLGLLREGERGVGDHPLTIFDRETTFVFDLSHIYFDGGWGSALSEIMTNQAIDWANRLYQLPDAQPAAKVPCSLRFAMSEVTKLRYEDVPQTIPEITVESAGIDIKGMQKLIKKLRNKSQLLNVTVNDFLVLYRAIHAVTYEAPPEIIAELKQMQKRDSMRLSAEVALEALEPEPQSPAILIPVDARPRSPRDRVYPTTFEVPLGELELLDLHRRTVEALNPASQNRFSTTQRHYFTALAGYSALMQQMKSIAISGQSASIGTIKLLAYMPERMQQALEKIPNRFDVLNDLIKGREVFSNVGAVVQDSTLTRFITAKDDNEKKTLAWGILTDANGTMHITLRDFRPHVRLLKADGHSHLAQAIAEDYLNSYVTGLNQHIEEMLVIVTRADALHLSFMR